MIDHAAISVRAPSRAEIAAAVAAFEAKHGPVETTPIICKQPKRLPYNGRGGMALSKAGAMSVSRRQRELESRVRQLAYAEIEGVRIKRSPLEIARIMRAEISGVNSNVVSQIAARLGIELRETKK